MYVRARYSKQYYCPPSLKPLAVFRGDEMPDLFISLFPLHVVHHGCVVDFPLHYWIEVDEIHNEQRQKG